MKVWLDGDLVDGDDARVSVFDHGFTVGDGVFETLRTHDGRPVALGRHLRRLARSVERLGLPPLDHDRVRTAVADTLAAHAPEEAGRVRITVTGGPAPLGSGRGDKGSTVVVAVGPGRVWDSTASLVTVPWPRNERSPVAGLKTTSYAENVVALAWAAERGAEEALFLNTAGYVCEGTGSNVFAVLADGRVVTPPLSSGCLAGITRELLLDWTDAEEADLTPEELAGAPEVFVTSSTRDIQPVRTLDGTTYVAPGPVTVELQRTFAERLPEELG